MYDDILFPTDGSDAAAAAFEHAKSLAAQYGAQLHLLYVVDTTYAGVGATGSSKEKLQQIGSTALENLSADAAEAGIDVETHIAEGDPYDEILAASETMDVIVMGTRGRSGIDRYLLGSVTEKVVRTADIPVVTIRDSG